MNHIANSFQDGDSDVFRNLKICIGAIQLNWKTMSRNRVRDEAPQIIVTSKIAGEAYDRVVSTEFEDLSQLITALRSEYDRRVTVDDLNNELNNA